MTPILQTNLPALPWMVPAMARLPGIQPLSDPQDWLRVDEAFAGQMALRDRLIADRPAEVHALLPEAAEAAGELLAAALALLPGLGFRVSAETVRRPDGAEVPVDRAAPLLTLGRLVQEDLCLLHPGPAGHRLTGAILCFPASWTLEEKIGRAMLPIHAPVPAYGADMAARVQRLFDALRPGRPLWRMNANPYMAPDLFHPRREADPRPPPAGPAPFLRCERQVLLRLPQTGAVVFSIHTYVVSMDSLPADARAALDAHAET